MTKLQPFGNRIAVQIQALEENLGGIIVTTSKDKSNRGLVVAVGDGGDVQNIKEGDTVIFSMNAGISYTDENNSYRVVDIRDVIGKVIGE